MGKIRQGLGQIVLAYEKHVEGQSDKKLNQSIQNLSNASRREVYQSNNDYSGSEINAHTYESPPDYHQHDTIKCDSPNSNSSSFQSSFTSKVSIKDRYSDYGSDISSSGSLPPPAIPPRPRVDRSPPFQNYADYEKQDCYVAAPPTPALQQEKQGRDTVLPVVIPQGATSPAERFTSPFARVYAPQLQLYGISMPDFINLIDGLNEAYIASPAFQAIGMAGKVAGFAPSAIANGVGALAQVGSGLGSAMNSISRSRAFIARANEQIFLPRGLVARMCSTKEMQAACRCEMITLARDGSMQNTPAPQGSIDPRKAFLSRLDGFVAPLSWDVTEQTMPNNWMKKMGAWQAQRQETRMQNSLVNGPKKSKKEIEIESEIDTINARLASGRSKDSKKDYKELEKLRKDVADEQKKGKKNAPPTEQEVLAAIKWIVITPCHSQSFNVQK